MKTGRITLNDLETLRIVLRPLIGYEFSNLSLPSIVLKAFEPSQIGTIIGTLMDALIPHLDKIPSVGLNKAAGILGEREGYPDYIHETGFRLELKLLYIDNPNLPMKRPPTRREASARLTQKVTVKNVIPEKDVLLLIAYQLHPQLSAPAFISPKIIDFEVFSMIELVEARDKRLLDGGGRWFGHYETPTILSKFGKRKIGKNKELNTLSYGRKESEGKDFNEDTNFGKIKRIPHPSLQAFLKKYQLVSVGLSQDREGFMEQDIIV